MRPGSARGARFAPAPYFTPLIGGAPSRTLRQDWLRPAARQAQEPPHARQHACLGVPGPGCLARASKQARARSARCGLEAARPSRHNRNARQEQASHHFDRSKRFTCSGTSARVPRPPIHVPRPTFRVPRSRWALRARVRVTHVGTSAPNTATTARCKSGCDSAAQKAERRFPFPESAARRGVNDY